MLEQTDRKDQEANERILCDHSSRSGTSSEKCPRIVLPRNSSPTNRDLRLEWPIP